MRHDAWRRDPASYPLRGELLPRYTDVDVWQHLNNTALIAMHGEALQHALRDLLGAHAWRRGEPAIACAASATDFLAEGQYPQPLDWGARVLRIDAGGLHLASALFQHGACVGLHGCSLAGWAGGAIAGLGTETLATLRAAAVPGVEAADPLAAPAVAAAPEPDPEHFPWRTTLATRFGDADARRLASDHCLARFAEQVRVEFLGGVFDARTRELGGMLVAHVGLRWLHRAAPGPRWEAGCGVAHVGERSIAVRAAMYDAGRCVAVAESVMVTIDPASRRSAPLSEGARAALARFRLGVAGSAGPTDR